ncbi:hypothetical protein SAMN02745753_02731 [Marinomonas polaris DSM 16579]|uniref:Uncharacterized protein n=1 Tax=Marinomonas polaris DSM 16579 TaxID=1122206 RepID=A0A1M5EYM9_9GAMM|nr:hypothetical protein [Marinomonas polaris]SHF84308.1 hypothetical protein SAMN02745753_02731 [Marinomonas polaris DSM 16579]
MKEILKNIQLWIEEEHIPITEDVNLFNEESVWFEINVKPLTVEMSQSIVSTIEFFSIFYLHEKESRQLEMEDFNDAISFVISPNNDKKIYLLKMYELFFLSNLSERLTAKYTFNVKVPTEVFRLYLELKKIKYDINPTHQ